MQSPLIVSGDAAGRLSTWRINAGVTSPFDGVLRSLVPACVCTTVPFVVGNQVIADLRTTPILNPDLALYASTSVLRRLGVYSGTLVEVCALGPRAANVQLKCG